MQTIMFEYRRFGLEQAVIARLKENTRRRVRFPKGVNDEDVESAARGIDKKGRVYFTFSAGTESFDIYPKYQIGEQVAVAQAYRDIRDIIGDIQEGKSIKFMAGWNNKMFTKAELMPHVIKITDIKAERLQDISDEDCQREGVQNGPLGGFYVEGVGMTFRKSMVRPIGQTVDGEPVYGDRYRNFKFDTPRAAFAALIDRLNGRGTWERNEWQFAYTFKLIK